MIAIFSFVLFWLVCAALSASILLGYFQNKYPEIAKESYRQDFNLCWGSSLLCGPLALFMSLFFTEFCGYGLMNPFVFNKYKD